MSLLRLIAASLAITLALRNPTEDKYAADPNDEKYAADPNDEKYAADPSDEKDAADMTAACQT